MGVDPDGASRGRCLVPGCECSVYGFDAPLVRCNRCNHTPLEHQKEGGTDLSAFFSASPTMSPMTPTSHMGATLTSVPLAPMRLVPPPVPGMDRAAQLFFTNADMFSLGMTELPEPSWHFLNRPVGGRFEFTNYRYHKSRVTVSQRTKCMYYCETFNAMLWTAFLCLGAPALCQLKRTVITCNDATSTITAVRYNNACPYALGFTKSATCNYSELRMEYRRLLELKFPGGVGFHLCLDDPRTRQTGRNFIASWLAFLKARGINPPED